MKEIWLNQKEKALAFWKKLSRTQQILFVTGVALTLVVAVLLISFATKPDFVPLYTNLEPQDAAAITDYLKEKKIPYKLADEGKTILVPSTFKYQLRLDLANEGLPSGGSVGFEFFNQSGFGETESQRRIRYLIALQGELERTIKKLEAVEDVRVHIVVPEPSLFTEKEKEATASVLVKLKPGRKLDERQVLGLMRLVASGVEGLKPENVTVVDVHGNVLSEGIAEEKAGAQLTANQMKIQEDYERKLERSIQSMLERVVGPGKAVVRANVILDFDQVEIRKEDYGDRTVRSQQVKEESSTSRTPTAEGEPGPGSNIPLYGEATGGQGLGQYQKTEKITNYEVDKEEEYRVVAPGQVKQLSLSVVIDGELDLQKQQEIEDLVASAAGINPERGDTVTVTGMPFNTAWAQKMEAEMEAERKRQQMLTYGLAVAGIVGFSLLLFLVSRSLKRREEKELMPRPTLVEETTLPEEELSEEERERIRVLQNIQNLVKKSPKEVAQLIKVWLAEKPR
jgi:flagellar M-ring protein FliF